MATSVILPIYICGVTCAGKTTLSKLLTDSLHCDIIFIGEILRSEYSPQCISSGDKDSKEFFPNISKILFLPNRFFSEITGWEISHRDKLWHACGILKQIRFCKGIPNSESLLAAPACLQIKVIEQIEFPPKKTKLQKKHHHYCNYQISQLSQRGAKCARGMTTIYSSTVLTDIRYAKGTKDTSTDSSTVAERHTF